MQQELKSAENKQRKNTEDHDFEKKCEMVKKQLKRLKDSKKIEPRILKMKFTV
jgi:hypothetical protein